MIAKTRPITRAAAFCFCVIATYNPHATATGQTMSHNTENQPITIQMTEITKEAITFVGHRTETTGGAGGAAGVGTGFSKGLASISSWEPHFAQNLA